MVAGGGGGGASMEGGWRTMIGLAEGRALGGWVGKIRGWMCGYKAERGERGLRLLL